jgi:4,5-DOPA dioxygenase extradiol
MSMNTPSPVLFVPHGSPMFALEPGEAGAALVELAQALPQPRAIVVISPHWETQVPTVSVAAAPQTIHDFGGFDARLYDIQYPATGCPEVAQWVVDALGVAGLPAEMDEARGLDHGAWVPLLHMYPHAQVPVLQLSIQHHLGPEHAYRVGQALAPITQRGVMVMGTGSITHNLRDWQVAHASGHGTPPYVNAFADWLHERTQQFDTASLLKYRRLNPYAAQAHPRDEHLLPFFTALGAGGEQSRPQAFYRGVSDIVIAMDGYQFQ